jgi:crotonobetainyl-CoA:carnitine CoA-transferase CaiB-like acyl-CoA transferase
MDGVRIVNAGVNLPADAASARLTQLGASVTKVEPPDGDPMAAAAPGLYAELTEGQEIVRLGLKDGAGRAALDELLADADVLVTSSRPSALARLGLGWPELAERHPRLLQVAIVGHAAPDQELAGHDLTYSAEHGLLTPPAMPRTLVADLGGAERAVSAALALLLSRDGVGGGGERYAEVALADSAAFFALPLRHGVTGDGGFLGGADPYYGLYEARDGWIALAALEPKFRRRLVEELGADPSATAFATRSAADWQRWAEERDLPLAAVFPPTV